MHQDEVIFVNFFFLIGIASTFADIGCESLGGVCSESAYVPIRCIDKPDEGSDWFMEKMLGFSVHEDVVSVKECLRLYNDAREREAKQDLADLTALVSESSITSKSERLWQYADLASCAAGYVGCQGFSVVGMLLYNDNRAHANPWYTANKVCLGVIGVYNVVRGINRYRESKDNLSTITAAFQAIGGTVTVVQAAYSITIDFKVLQSGIDGINREIESLNVKMATLDRPLSSIGEYSSENSKRLLQEKITDLENTRNSILSDIEKWRKFDYIHMQLPVGLTTEQKAEALGKYLKLARHLGKKVLDIALKSPV